MTYVNAGTAPRKIRIITNLRRLDGCTTAQYQAVTTFLEDAPSIWSGIRLFFKAFRYDVVVLSSETKRLLVYCILQTFLPFGCSKIVAVDHVLPEPRSAIGKLLGRVKGLFLNKIDCFILHFVDTRSYATHYGILPQRCVFVPFKVNYLEKIPEESQLSSDGEYVFTAGRSFRDFPTFVHAMRTTGYPGLLLYEDLSVMNKGGTQLDLNQIPANLKVVRNVGEISWVRFIAKAKIVVVPLLPRTGYAPGLSLYLMAMAMKKCVIITEGLSTTGMITNQAVIVPPKDPIAMAEAITHLWQDEESREKVAVIGQSYARSLGGEPRLLRDILNICGSLLERGKTTIGNAVKGTDDQYKIL